MAVGRGDHGNSRVGRSQIDNLTFQTIDEAWKHRVTACHDDIVIELALSTGACSTNGNVDQRMYADGRVEVMQARLEQYLWNVKSNAQGTVKMKLRKILVPRRTFLCLKEWFHHQVV